MWFCQAVFHIFHINNLQIVNFKQVTTARVSCENFQQSILTVFPALIFACRSNSFITYTAPRRCARQASAVSSRELVFSG